jgi:hypothetical protein
MSLPDRNCPAASFAQEEAQEEAIESLSRTVAQVLERMPPLARLRLIAFMHLVEDPGALNASLGLTPSGRLSLTLEALVAPARGHQH